MLDSATPPLSRSSLNHRGRVLGGIVGTLCPNPILSGGQSFDERTGSRFALVVRDQLGERDWQQLAELDVTVVSTQESVELDRWLGQAHGALIRPDRTVMAKVDPTSLPHRMGTLRQVHSAPIDA